MKLTVPNFCYFFIILMSDCNVTLMAFSISSVKSISTMTVISLIHVCIPQLYKEPIRYSSANGKCTQSMYYPINVNF